MIERISDEGKGGYHPTMSGFHYGVRAWGIWLFWRMKIPLHGKSNPRLISGNVIPAVYDQILPGDFQ